MNMKLAFTLSFILSLFSGYTQSPQEEIDAHVWVPFTKAWEANDAKAYNALHSDDVWRINPGRLLIGKEYKKSNSDRMTGQKNGRIIELSFETRTSNNGNAYEVGYYRITTPSAEGNGVHAGRFHIALKKIKGKWKITQDWDTGEINGEKIDTKTLEKRDFIHYQ